MVLIAQKINLTFPGSVRISMENIGIFDCLIQSHTFKLVKYQININFNVHHELNDTITGVKLH